MPEGDSLRAIASRMQVMVGDTVRVEAEHPRARALGVAERLDGRDLVAVEARGKHLILRFEPRLVLVSHLMMRGRWRVRPLSETRHERGRPWLRMTGATHEATQWNGPVLELGERRLRALGPDILEQPAPLDRLLASLRRADQRRELGDVLLDQSVVAGVGNRWRSELLFDAKIAPRRRLRELSDDRLVGLLERASDLMNEGRTEPRVYRRTGRPCTVCSSPIVSRRLGEHARAVYWCPCCQAGNDDPST